jgi:hypothetical protein
MKNILIIIFNLLIAQQIAFAQNFNSDADITNYLNENVLVLDFIEGIWSVKVTTNVFENNKLIKRYSHNEEWQIIKKNGKFTRCNINKDKLTHGSDPVTFSKTANKGIYIFQVTGVHNAITGNFDRTVRSNAFITDGEVLRFSEEMLLGDDMSSIWEYEMIKLFPLEDDIIKEKKKIESLTPKISKGTGFAVSKNIIVTNWHVIENAKSIKVIGIKGDLSKSYTANLIQSDKNNDLAILSLEDTSIKVISPFNLKMNQIDVGSDVYVFGYPLTATMGNEIKLTNGIVSAKSGFQGDITSYQISAPVQRGNSGGPVFDKNGYLIGIVNARHLEAENVSYCVKSIYLKNFIDVLPTTKSLPKTNIFQKMSLTEMVKTISKYVYIIEVEY